MLLRHFTVVMVLVCLVSMPSRSEGATISLGDLGTGATGFGGELADAGDIAFFSFSLSAASSIGFEVDSHICEEPGDLCGGFLPILTLFEGTAPSGPGYLLDATFDPTITTLTLEQTFNPGNYLLAITLYPNYFEPFADPGRFASELNPEFLAEAGLVLENCAFPQPVGDVLECRSGAFAGSLNVETEQAPEPGMLAFILVGGASLAMRRRRKRPCRRQADVLDHS